MNKNARDNRANQMNPNNPAYYKSRQGNHSKGKSKTKVVHHHHHTEITIWDLDANAVVERGH